MPASSPSERVLIARIAAHTRWASEPDRVGATKRARAAFEDRWTRQVDPDGLMDEQTRLKAAENARKAFYIRLGRASAAARRAKKAASKPRQGAS